MTAPQVRQRVGHRARPSLVVALMWFGGSYGGAILGYVAVNALASRMLGDRFGYFVIAVSASMMVGQVGLFGAHRGGLREAARLDHGDTDGLADLRRSVRVVSLVTLPATALLGGVATLVLLRNAEVGQRWLTAAVMVLMIWLSGQQKLWANYLRGFGKVRFAGLLEGRSGGALVAASQGAAMAVALLLFHDSGLPVALLAMAVGFALPVAGAWFVVWRGWRGTAAGPVSPRLVGQVVSRHRHFAYNMLAGSLGVNMELWLSGAVLSRMDSSLFGAANRISMLLPIFIMSLGVVFSPMVSRLWGNDDPTLERLLRTGATLASVGTAVLWVPLLVVPGFVLGTLFGTTFEAAAPILVILTVGAISNVVTGMCSVVLTMSQHEAVVAKVQWAFLVPRLVLGLLLAHAFGAIGLAASAAVMTSAQWLSLWYLTKRLTGMRTHPTLRPSPRLMLRIPA